MNAQGEISADFSWIVQVHLIFNETQRMSMSFRSRLVVCKAPNQLVTVLFISYICDLWSSQYPSNREKRHGVDCWLVKVDKSETYLNSIAASLFVWNWLSWQIVIQDPKKQYWYWDEVPCLNLPDRPSASRGRWRRCQRGPWSRLWGRREAPQWCSSKPSWSSSISIERGPLLLVSFSSSLSPPQVISAKFSLHTDHITSWT